MVAKKTRNRNVQSCFECHRRKVKCDREQPCTACVRYGTVDGCSFAEVTKKSPRGSKRTANGRIADATTISTSAASIPQDYSLDLDMNQSPATSNPSSATEEELPTPNTLASETKHSTQGFFVSFIDQAAGKQSPLAIVEPISYSSDTCHRLQSACKLLPDRTNIQLAVSFYLKEMDQLYHAMSAAEVTSWLTSAIDRLFGKLDSPNWASMLQRHDATRLAVITTIMLATAQLVDEGLLRLWFLPKAPTIAAADLNRQSSNRRDIYTSLYRASSDLLQAAIELDDPSTLQVRSIILLLHCFKNEGQLAHPDHDKWAAENSNAVRRCKLHLAPDPNMHPVALDDRLWLWVNFFMCDRLIAVLRGTGVFFPEEECTVPLPADFDADISIKTRYYLVRMMEQMYRKRSAGLLNANAIDDMDAEILKIAASLPESYQFLEYVDIVPLDDPHEEQKRHLLYVMYNNLRTILHRLRFFESPQYPRTKVLESRRHCAESAIAIMKSSEHIRRRTFTTLPFRAFHFPYFILEAGVMLIICALVEFGDATTKSNLSPTVERYLSYVSRARDLIASIPPDVETAQQGTELLQRFLTKALNITRLVADDAFISSTSILNEVLCDENGQRIAMPYLESVSEQNNISQVALESSIPSNPHQMRRRWQQTANWSDQDNLPMLEDFDLGHLDNFAAVLPSAALETSPTDLGLEGQIDAWLAALQGVV